MELATSLTSTSITIERSSSCRVQRSCDVGKEMSVPTLDIKLAESDRGEAAKQLVAALEEPGFLFVKNVRGYDPGM